VCGQSFNTNASLMRAPCRQGPCLSGFISFAYGAHRVITQRETPFNPLCGWRQKNRPRLYYVTWMCVYANVSFSLSLVECMSKPCVIAGTQQKSEKYVGHTAFSSTEALFFCCLRLSQRTTTGLKAESFAFHKQWALRAKNLRAEIICCETLSSSL
jgi:hypothetical protein